MERSVVEPVHFAEWIARHALTRPDVPAIVAPQSRLTYAEFDRALNFAVGQLAEKGIARGDVVALCVYNAALHCVLVAALNRLGAASMSVTAGRDAPIALPESVAAAKVIIEEPFAGIAPDGALKANADWLKESGKPWKDPGFADENDVIRIFLTSGTTGKMKAVGLSTRQIEARVFKYSIGALGEGRSRAGLSAIGLRSSAGFRAVFSTFWSGGTIYIGWPERAIPAIVARNRIQRIEGSPAQLQQILREAGKGQFDFSAVRSVWLTGSSASKALIAAIRTRISPTLINIYGSTEMGTMAFGLLDARRAHVAGVLAPWVKGEAVDENDAPLPPGEEGRLRFKSAEMASGYMGDAQATAQHFRDGWFYPGDTGSVSVRGVVSLRGRSLDQINAGGVKVHPDIVEEAVLAIEGVEECAAFGAPDAIGVEQIWTAVVAAKEIDLARMHAELKTKLASRAPYRLFRLEKIPRNENGKVLRAELRKLAAGQLAPAN